MKKLMLLALLLYGVSCTNPEDRATGDPDSTSFNADEQKTPNTATDFNNPTTESPDTSSSPSVSTPASGTTGTNRGYGDSAKNQ